MASSLNSTMQSPAEMLQLKHVIEAWAVECGLTIDQVRELGIEVELNYDITYDGSKLMIGWGLRKYNSRRVLSTMIDRVRDRSHGYSIVHDSLMPVIRNVNFKTEYYCCMLPEKLRKSISRVVTVKGEIMLVFENGRVVAEPACDYPSESLLATASMLHDLPAVEQPYILSENVVHV